MDLCPRRDVVNLLTSPLRPLRPAVESRLPQAMNFTSRLKGHAMNLVHIACKLEYGLRAIPLPFVFDFPPVLDLAGGHLLPREPLKGL